MSEASLAQAVWSGKGLTARLADMVVKHQHEDMPDDLVTIAGWCVLDTIGVALAGINEPAASILRKEALDSGRGFSAALIGSNERVSLLSAALLNGTAAHALDYDDVHMSIPGHASACIVPAVLALAEEIGASGKDVTRAVISGFEIGCRIGASLSPGHYNAGFHATGTIGAIAAAAACSGLLGLDAERTAHALGIAAGQAAGLKSMMGTMCKPLNAGRAAYNGLLSARLASGGFVARSDILECEQGFGATHGPNFSVEAAISSPPEGFYLRSNIFKFHASCVLTHAPIEAVRALLQHRQFRPAEIVGIVIRVDRIVESVCRFDHPQTSLEAKFSVPFAVALAVLSHDTGWPDIFNDEILIERGIVELMMKIRVEYKNDWPMTLAEVEVSLSNEEVVTKRHDINVDRPSSTEIDRRIKEKFSKLAAPIIGALRASEIVRFIEKFELQTSIKSIPRLWAPLA